MHHYVPALKRVAQKDLFIFSSPVAIFVWVNRWRHTLQNESSCHLGLCAILKLTDVHFNKFKSQHRPDGLTQS